jgi:hypothetical protein
MANLDGFKEMSRDQRSVREHLNKMIDCRIQGKMRGEETHLVLVQMNLLKKM